VIEREIALRPGQVLDLDDPGIEVSRYRLLSTGFFSDVQLRLRRGQRRGRVIVVVDVVERWTFVVRDIYLGVSDITPYGGLHLDERNLLGLGISLSGAFVAGREQQGYRLRLAYPRFLDSAFALSLELLYNDAQDYLGRRPVLVAGMGEAEQKYAVIDYQRFGGAVGAGVRLAHHTLLYVDYRLELVRAQLPLAAAQLDQPLGPNFGEPLDFYLADDRSILSALVFSLIRDTLNHPLLPSEGQRLALSTTLSSDVIGSHYHYMKLTVEGDFYVKMSWNHSFRFGFLVGAIFGEAPLFERYFVGDLSDQMHARVLQLNFSHAPPPNVFRNSTEEMRYESLAARLDVEYIAPLYRGRRVVYGVDFFLSFGIYSLGSAEDFASPPAGYKGGAFPVDLTMDLGFRLDTNAGVFGFSFKTLLGLIPFSEE
jgi:outer membrane protein assembly factor BamA